MIKLVVSDLDGTLIDHSEVITPEARAVVRYLQAKDIHFSLATGRVQGMSEHIARDLGISVPYVTSNGASLIQNGSVVKRITMSLEPLKDLINAADRLGMSIIYCPDGYEKVHGITPYILSQQNEKNRYHNIVPLDESVIKSVRVEKLTILDMDKTGIMDQLEPYAKALSSDFSYTRYGYQGIEVVPGGRNKAEGVADLATLLGLEMSEVLCIGDDENDLEMLSRAGYSATVGNALPKVRAMVDYAATGNRSVGVLEAVRYIIEHQEV